MLMFYSYQICRELVFNIWLLFWCIYSLGFFYLISIFNEGLSWLWCFFLLACRFSDSGVWLLNKNSIYQINITRNTNLRPKKPICFKQGTHNCNWTRGTDVMKDFIPMSSYTWCWGDTYITLHFISDEKIKVMQGKK